MPSFGSECVPSRSKSRFWYAIFGLERLDQPLDIGQLVPGPGAFAGAPPEFIEDLPRPLHFALGRDLHIAAAGPARLPRPAGSSPVLLPAVPSQSFLARSASTTASAQAGRKSDAAKRLIAGILI